MEDEEQRRQARMMNRQAIMPSYVNFFAVQLQGSGMVMGLMAQKSSTRAYLADYLSLIFYIFSFSIINNIIYILVVSVVADYSKNRVEGGISLHLSKGCVFWRSPKKFRY